MAVWSFVRKMCALVVLVSLCAACSSGPPLRPDTAALPERVELIDVPFFMLSDDSGAPSAIAALLNHHGVIATPGMVETRIHEKAGLLSAQEAAAVAARSYDQVVYPLAGNLDALILQIAGGNPVLVRLEPGFTGPAGEFALLVGYDQRQHIFVLRKGNLRRWMVSLADFDEAWADSGRWAVLVLPANKLPVQPDRERWLQAVDELRNQGREAAANRGVAAAQARWPE